MFLDSEVRRAGELKTRNFFIIKLLLNLNKAVTHNFLYLL